MQKHLSFGITAAVLLTAIVTVTLYTVNAAHAQGNATSAGDAAKNITNATAGPAVVATKNMTGVIIGAAKNAPGK
jgi:hypothetical protein